jgi:RimJ/RimL family protein N-acetyltransferase
MHISLLSATDAHAYKKLMLEAYTLAADAFTSTAEERAAEPIEFWRKRIADPKGLGLAFGAFVGADLVGTVSLEFSNKPKTRHKAKVIGMYVSPAARGAGAGAKLLSAAIDYAKAKEGLLLLGLTVTQGNEAAITLYRNAGFETFGVEPLAIRTADGYKAKVHMWLSLHN